MKTQIVISNRNVIKDIAVMATVQMVFSRLFAIPKALSKQFVRLAIALHAVVVIFANLLLLSSAEATWYRTKLESGSDIFMGDVQWPKWSPSTYYTLWNSKPVGGGGYFYGGFTSDAHGAAQSDPNYKPQITWSFWRGKAYEGKPMKPLWFAKDVQGLRMDFEGAILGFTGSTDFVKAGTWYRALVRTWRSIHDPKNVGYIGWWMKNQESGEWYCLGVAELPMEVKGLGGNACFVEATGYGKTQRSLKRRAWYYRLDADTTWHPSDQITTEGNIAKNFFVLSEDKREVVLNMVGETEKVIPKDGNRTSYQMKQPNTPAIGNIIKPTFKLRSVGTKVSIDWVIDKKSTPQLGYQIELFGNKEASGEPLMKHTTLLPYVRTAGFSTSEPVKAVKFSYIDVYNQKKSWLEYPTQVEFVKSEALSKKLIPGLNFRYFEYSTNSSSQDLLAVLKSHSAKSKAVTKGLSHKISTQPIKNRRLSHYGLSYQGYFKAPKDDVYTFEVAAADGCKIEIGGEVCFVRNSIRTPAPTRFSVFLAAGYHKLNFSNSRLKNSTFKRDWVVDRMIWLGVKTPTTSMRELGYTDYFVFDKPDSAKVEIASSAQLNNGETSFQIKYKVKGGSIHRIDIYHGATIFKTFLQSEIPNGSTQLNFSALLPEGKSQIKALLWQDVGRVVESHPIDVHSVNRIDSYWQNAELPDDIPNCGIVARKTSVATAAKTPFFVYRRMGSEDFTITGRLKSFEAVNGIHLAKLGFFVTDNPTKSSHKFSIFKNGDGTFRGEHDDRDLAGEGRSRYSYGSDDRWMKVVRRDGWLRAYLSEDGKAWRKVAEELNTWAKEKQLYIGVFAKTNNTTSASVLKGEIDHISIESPGEVPLKSKKAAFLKD